MKAPPGHVSMMQIDCEVMNTRLIHVREDAIPANVNRGRSDDDAYNASMGAGGAASSDNSSLQRNSSGDSSYNRSRSDDLNLDVASKYEDFVAAENEVGKTRTGGGSGCVTIDNGGVRIFQIYNGRAPVAAAAAAHHREMRGGHGGGGGGGHRQGGRKHKRMPKGSKRKNVNVSGGGGLI